MENFRIVSITPALLDQVAVAVYCPEYRKNRKYLEEKYPLFRIFRHDDVSSLEDIFNQELSREFLISLGVDVPESFTISAKVHGITDKDTAMLMKLELGGD